MILWSCLKTTPRRPGHWESREYRVSGMPGSQNLQGPGHRGVKNHWCPRYRRVATCLLLGYQGAENRRYLEYWGVKNPRCPGHREVKIPIIHTGELLFYYSLFFKLQAIATAFKATINQKRV